MFKLYSNNLVNQSVLTPSSENLLFPKSNLKHPFRSKVFRSTANSCNIVIDFGETSEVNTFILVDNPRESFGVSTVTLEMNGTSDFSAPPFTIEIPLNIQHGLGFVEFDLQSYRFARLVLTSTDEYCELSNFFIGKSIEFENGMGIDIGWSFADEDLSIIKKNRYNQKFVDKIGRQREFEFNLNAMNPDEFDQVLEVLDSKGTTEPFFVKIGDTGMINDPARFTSMVYLKAMPKIRNIAYALYGLPMALDEAM